MPSLIDRLKYHRNRTQLRQLVERLERDYGPPLILIGMHRSGTSMMTQLLRRCGGYFGHQLVQEESEAYEMIRINRILLHMHRSSWYSLAPEFDLHDLRKQNMTTHYLVNGLRHHLWPGFFEHFGAEGKPFGNNQNPPMPRRPRRNSVVLNWPRKRGSAPFWGWKDPRTTLTLPVWLRLFPRARVLHMVRNGIGSALSLWTRARRDGIGAPECEDPLYCFRLWERYVEEGLRWRSLGPARYLEMKYEDVLADPATAVRSVLDFVGVDAKVPADLKGGVDVAKGGKAHWREHPELIALADESRVQRMLYGGSAALAPPG
jgi:hypothetical protein